MDPAPDARRVAIASAGHATENRLTAAVPRLTPRSAGAVADTELLRVARTDIAPVAAVRRGLAGRIRAMLGRHEPPAA